tara:strand:- start:15911 stop:16642 length:732 start_codon:yes stop_codon:yes gene_type:complete
MGFLDHSTNNIIVDAVLTDAGRRALARNDGSFQVFQFGLGDDEVDYEIIKHFGRTVGKEKIEKNTPVLEGLTAGSLALKHRLASIDNEFVTHFPSFSISANGTSTANTSVDFTRNSTENNLKRKKIVVEVQPFSGAPEVDVQLIDSAFRVEMNHLFLRIERDQPNVIFTDNIAVYDVDANEGSGNITSTSAFALAVKQITNTTFNIYATSGGNFIKTFVKVTGINSGLTTTFEVRINNPASAT